MSVLFGSVTEKIYNLKATVPDEHHALRKLHTSQHQNFLQPCMCLQPYKVQTNIPAIIQKHKLNDTKPTELRRLKKISKLL